MIKKLILTCCLLATGFSVADAQLVSLNTDIAWDALLMPNLGAEMTVGKRSTIGLNILGAYKPYGKDIKGFAIQPEYRFYFSGRTMHREFVGIGLIGADYDITWKQKRYDGFAYGAGITFGYVWNLTSRLNLDFHAGVGAIGYLRKEYYLGDNYDEYIKENGDVKANSSGYYILPTRIGISLTYIIK